jgi:arginine deiminase
MVDYKKFIFSPNMIGEVKFWEIALSADKIKSVPLKEVRLEAVLNLMIGVYPIMIPVAGNQSKLRIDIETKFDATNFFVMKPGVIVGYDRNYATIEALKANKVRVEAFSGDSLSLGMGSARCMTMPLIREDLHFKHLDRKNKS